MKKAFTLVELLLYMGILGILLSILSTLFVNIVNANLSSKSFSLIDIEANTISNKIKYDIRNSSQMITPSTTGSTSSQLVIVKDSQNITYSLSSTDLNKQAGVDNNKINSNLVKINSLTFKKIGSQAVLVTYEIQSVPTPFSGVEIKTFNTLVTLR